MAGPCYKESNRGSKLMAGPCYRESNRGSKIINGRDQLLVSVLLHKVFFL